MVSRIEQLPVKQLIDVLENIHEYTITEKIDGSQLLIGVDEYGFYTSRETKGGTRIYNVDDYPVQFATTYMRTAHAALYAMYGDLVLAGLTAGNQVEVEILYGKLPNAVPYSADINRVIFLRTTLGTVDTVALAKCLQDSNTTVTLTVPTTKDGKTIQHINKTSTWTFSCTPSLYLPQNMAEKLLPFITELKCLKKKDTALINEVKQMMLTELVHNTASKFGPAISDNGWIEGVVLRSNTGEQIKIIDDTVFTQVRDFVWKERDSLTTIAHNVHNTTGIMGNLLVELGNTLGYPQLGTRRAKRCLSTIGDKKDTVVDILAAKIEAHKYWPVIIETYINRLNAQLDVYNSVKHTYSVTVNIGCKACTFVYDSAVDERTLQTYAYVYKLLNNMRNDVSVAETSSDAILILIGKHYA